MRNDWTIFALYSNAFIQAPIEIDEYTSIIPLPVGLGAKDKAELIEWAVSKFILNGEQWIFQRDILDKYRGDNSTLCVRLKMDLQSESPDEIFELAKKRLNIVTNFLSYYQKNAIELFGIILANSKFYVKIIHDNPRKIHQFDNLPQIFKSAIELSERQPRVKLYFDIYYDALKETDLDFKYFKLYSLLEVMAQPYGDEIPFPTGIIPDDEKDKRKPYPLEKVKALFVDLEIGIPLINDKSLVDIASKHRNCVSHFGMCSPDLNSKCAAWCKDLIVKKEDGLKELIELVNFTVRRFIGKYGR